MAKTKTFWLQKIPHTVDTESLNQRGEKHRYQIKVKKKCKNNTRELKFSTGHHLLMLEKNHIAQSQQHKPLKKIFLPA